MSILLAYKVTSPTSPPPPSGSDWTATEVGTGSLTSFDDTAGVLTIEAAGPDQDNCVFVHQTVSSAQDIQLKCRITTNSDLTGAGTAPFIAPAIRQGTATGNPVLLNRWRGDLVRHNGGYRNAQDGTTTGGFFGDATFVLPVYSACVYDLSADTAALWETDAVSPVDGVDWIENGTNIDFAGGLTFPCEVGFLVCSDHATNTITAEIDNTDVSATITLVNNPPASPRSLRAELDWETGSTQDPKFKDQNGVYKDAVGLKQSIEDGSPRTVSAISKANPGIVTYSGARINDGDGVTFSDTNFGMTELRGKLVRAKDTTSSTFSLYWDGQNGDPPNGWNDDEVTDVGDNTKDKSTAINTTGFGTYTSGGTVQPWMESNSPGADENSGFGVRVVPSGFSAPDNLIGSGETVTSLRGSYFLATHIYFERDHAMFGGNAFKNKCRFTMSLGQEDKPFAYNEEEWFSISYYLPSNFHHDQETGTKGNTNLIQTTAGNNNDYWRLLFNNEGAGNGSMEWILNWWNGAAVTAVSLGNAITDGDIGKWTTLTFKQRVHTGANGILEVWKGVGDYTSGFQRNQVKVFSRTGAAVGDDFGANKFQYGLRQYKHGWHHNENTIDSIVQFMGFDEIRWGGVNEGTDYSDVDPFQRSEP